MDDFYGEDLAWVHAEAFEALAASAAESLLKALGETRATGRVLDLGCGAGPLSRRLREIGYATWGLDLSPALVDLARSRIPDAEFVCGSVLDSDFPSAIAVAAIGEVLNYATADDPEGLSRVFRRVFEVLEPGGRFLFDLAGPGRVGPGRGYSEGDGWGVGLIAREEGEFLVRDISTFREFAPGIWRRSRETHRLRLWPREGVLAQLEACGFRPTTLGGYADMTMPPALHVYLAVKPV